MKTKLNKIATKKYIANELAADRDNAKRRAVAMLARLPLATLDERAALQIIGDTPSVGAYYSPWMSEYDGFRATLRVRVESIKDDPLLLDILNRAVERNLVVETTDFVSDWLVERSFRVSLPHGGVLTIEARVASDSKTCRKVQVGTETTETPRYELRCD